MFITAFRVIFLMKLRWPQNESHTCHFFVAGEIGGQLGLCIGASLLSLLEFLDVVFSMVNIRFGFARWTCESRIPNNWFTFLSVLYYFLLSRLSSICKQPTGRREISWPGRGHSVLEQCGSHPPCSNVPDVIHGLKVTLWVELLGYRLCSAPGGLFLDSNLVPRVSLLCLHCLWENDNGGREERPWERGCLDSLLFACAIRTYSSRAKKTISRRDVAWILNDVIFAHGPLWIALIPISVLGSKWAEYF